MHKMNIYDMKNICIFCGSSMGQHTQYREAADTLGRLIAEQGLSLVYGGANVGLMKVIADSVLVNGGIVSGIMPHILIDKEIAHNGIQHMYKVNSMAERKQMMAEASDAFIAMPGGIGTMDEVFEILTLNQLRIIGKPLGLLNTNGYFNYMLQWIDQGVQEGFIRAEHRHSIIVHHEPKALIELLRSYQPVETEKWIAQLKDESNS